MISRLTALATLIAFMACTPAQGEGEDTTRTGDASPATTIVLVRHAEKAPDPPDDPPLTEVGHARAAALVEALGEARIDAVYSTQYERNRATAEPLAAAAGVELAIVRAAEGEPPYIPIVAERARTEHPGGVVVIVGHSNTLGETIAELGGPDNIGELPDDAFDRFYVMLVREGEPARLIQARFGAPTP